MDVLLICNENCSDDLKNAVRECYQYDYIIRQADNESSGDQLDENVITPGITNILKRN